MATPTTPATVKPTVVTSSATIPASPTAEIAIGKTVINDGVIAKVAGIAAREVSGVHALGGGAARVLGSIRSAMNNTDLSQGITVEVGETQVAVDVTIVAEYPVPLQDVADKVRSSIVDAIETLVGMEVTEVNVTIVDVFIPSDDADDETEARVQ
ncbi:Asp23/Gls24 family envelope stress response protein [Subtercola boreus]|uniref:Alkaline-shock protein n=1 Tax=Subtercola boreus TaxID=120213 RepID=A0A3E0WF04_9MICO|nr:Asp23/Gls24 family envelope stress response protein [Subtercola boreus]RFA23346.1 alkaline-shock protein [Subtercola boreus]RFA23739.1 alkaline-shock protein [Subtercola boreus]RFA29439.1 alkaline-shock protein [Subtercola boreus]